MSPARSVAAFAGGAVTGAFSRAFNDELHRQRSQVAQPPLTAEQMQLAEQGQAREFWKSRLESGDPIAQLALDIQDN
ncbi:MAG: hypothetical protein OXF68_14240 [Gammaproteobacteria bacterium]|nr:hypothetical protein [Gammaproteobacteria bacterium]